MGEAFQASKASTYENFQHFLVWTVANAVAEIGLYTNPLQDITYPQVNKHRLQACAHGV